MELKQLEIFAKVVEVQSFSKAAKELYVSQPTVSSNIVALEKEFEVKLFERTTKKVSVTKEGEKFYRYAKEILEVSEELYYEFGKSYRQTERIVLAGSTIPSLYILPELVLKFQKKYPNVQFSIEQGDSSEVIQKVLSHQVAIGMVGQIKEDSRLCYIPFCRDKLVVITPVNNYYQELFRTDCTIKRFLEEPVIFREQKYGEKKEAELFLERYRITEEDLNVIAYMNDQEMIKRSVSCGMGISFISKRAAMDYAELGKIYIYEPEEEVSYRELYLVFEAKKKFDKLEKKFLDFTMETYKK